MGKYVLAQDWSTLGGEGPEAMKYWEYLNKKELLEEQEATTLFEKLSLHSLWLAGYIIPHERFMNEKLKRLLETKTSNEQRGQKEQKGQKGQKEQKGQKGQKSQKIFRYIALRDFYTTQEVPSAKDIIVRLGIDIYAIMENSHKSIAQRFNEAMVLLHYFVITGIVQSLTQQIMDLEFAGYIAGELVNKDLIELVKHIARWQVEREEDITTKDIEKLKQFIRYDYSHPMLLGTAKVVTATAYTQAWSILHRWKLLAKILASEDIYYLYALTPLDSFDTLYLFSYPMHYWETLMEVPLAPTHLPSLWYTFFAEEIGYKELKISQ